MRQFLDKFGARFEFSPSIKARAIFLTVAVLICFLIQGTAALIGGLRFSEFISYMSTEDWPTRTQLEDLDRTAIELERSLFLTVSQAGADEETLSSIQKLTDQLVAHWTVANALVGASTDIDGLVAAQQSIGMLPRLTTALVEAHKAGAGSISLNDPTTNLLSDLIAATRQVRTATNGMEYRLNASTSDKIERQTARHEASMKFMAIGSVLGLLVLVGATLSLSTGITGRLNSLTGFLRRLADNDFDAAVPLVEKNDELGDLARALDSFRENTHRRQLADDRLRDASASFETIVNTIRDGIVAIDANSKIRMFNRAAEEIFGWKAEDAIGKNVTILIPSNSRPNHETYVNRSDLHGPMIMDKGRDLTGLHHDGSEFPLELTVLPAELNGEKVFVAVCRDITNRKAAETEIHEKSEMLELLYDISSKSNRAVTGAEAMAATVRDVCTHVGLPVGHIYVREEEQPNQIESSRIWYLEDSEKFAAFQAATESKPFGWAEGLPGRVLSSAQPEWIEDVAADPRFRRSDVAKAAGIKSGFAVPVMVRSEVIAVLEFFACETLSHNQSLLDALTNVGLQLGRVVERRRAAKALMDKESALQEHVETLSTTQKELREKGRQLAAHRDKLEATVAERTAELEHALDQEKEFNALQREFVAMASHEFRTPITVIDGEMRRIMKRAESIGPDEIAERGDTVRQAVKQMTGLIDSTLSLSRLEAGQIELKLEKCSIKDLVTEAADRQQSVSPHHQITADVDELPDEITADPQLIDQSLSNLLSNAAKYSQEDPRIRVTGMTDGAFVVITVRDHGVGIPAEEMPRMFERFFRARTSIGISGTGIGLTVVKQFVESHNGTVDVESVEGEGSVFTIRLPIAGPDDTSIGAAMDSYETAFSGVAGVGPRA